MNPEPTSSPLVRLLRDTRGLTTVEYTIILMLIAILGMVTWQALGDTIATKAGVAAEQIDDLGGEGSGSSDSTTGGGTTPDQVKKKKKRRFPADVGSLKVPSE